MSGTWHGVPVTFRQTNVELDVFVDGVLIGHTIGNERQWQWVSAAGPIGWTVSRTHAVDCLLRAHEAALEEWAKR